MGIVYTGRCKNGQQKVTIYFCLLLRQKLSEFFLRFSLNRKFVTNSLDILSHVKSVATYLVKYMAHFYYACNAMLARYLMSSRVRLSCVTRRYCIKTAKRRISKTTPHNSPRTLVSWCKISLRNSDGITPIGGAKARWGR